MYDEYENNETVAPAENTVDEQTENAVTPDNQSEQTIDQPEDGVIADDEKAREYAAQTEPAMPVMPVRPVKEKRRKNSGKRSGTAAILVVAAALILSVGLVASSFILGQSLVSRNTVSSKNAIEDALSDNNADNFVKPAVEFSVPVASTPEYSFNSSTTGKMDIPSVAEKVNPSVVDVYVTTQSGYGFGTGIIFSEDGYIVTCAHVVEGMDKVYVYLYGDSEQIPATVVGYDTYTDVGVIKIDRTGLTPAEIGDSTKLVQGEQVISIGTPCDISLSHTLTAGIVSAIRNNYSFEDLNLTLDIIQHTATINQGNSGGPLVNMYGQVVGINSVKTMGNIYTGTYEDISFAIQMNTALPIIEELINNGGIARPQIGITGRTDTTVGGVYVSDISKDGGAAKADVKIGDIITKCDGVRVKTIEEFKTLLGKYNVGDTVEITILRDVDVVKTKIVLQAGTAETPASTAPVQEAAPSTGTEEIPGYYSAFPFPEGFWPFG